MIDREIDGQKKDRMRIELMNDQDEFRDALISIENELRRTP
jgi:hypothetical protein